ncbi:MAG: phosphoribosylamine--glycine ligase [Hyphomonadaceae bacterium]|nr:phosphoribosylamine--glycine ligase [Hyphomonadaceae bacterium]MBC6411600.1 phosphoribosylamine--glycine ligase [Hyphomonadaceae bacterium]
MKVLLAGSGGREHALAWKISQSPKVTRLVCAPGHAGIAQVAECVAVKADDIDGLVALATGFDFVVVGPEQPLALGLVDKLQDKNIRVFGPNQAAAQLESSKAFAKDFCRRYSIPTADYGVSEDLESALEFLETMTAPYVVKADGLAAGKGVVIAETRDTAEAELGEYFSGKFGKASQRVVIEEFMTGQEISFFAISDGKNALPLIGAQDHKRAYNGDKGPNTGGMGAYSPVPGFGELERDCVMSRIIQPTMDGMARDGHPFVGVLFAGLMMTSGGPKVIEYNVRFGDPECQVLMRRLDSDLMDILLAAEAGELSSCEPPTWSKDPVVNVVLATRGYPGSYEKGSIIRGLAAASNMGNVEIFHAGTSKNASGEIIAAGGRVLNVTTSGKTLGEAVDLAYSVIDNNIDWPEGFSRRDIGCHAL